MDSPLQQNRRPGLLPPPPAPYTCLLEFSRLTVSRWETARPRFLDRGHLNLCMQVLQNVQSKRYCLAKFFLQVVCSLTDRKTRCDMLDKASLVGDLRGLCLPKGQMVLEVEAPTPHSDFQMTNVVSHASTCSACCSLQSEEALFLLPHP